MWIRCVLLSYRDGFPFARIINYILPWISGRALTFQSIKTSSKLTKILDSLVSFCLKLCTQIKWWLLLISNFNISHFWRHYWLLENWWVFIRRILLIRFRSFSWFQLKFDFRFISFQTQCRWIIKKLSYFWDFIIMFNNWNS